MKRSRKQGNGPLTIKFPLIEHDDVHDDEESNQDIPVVLSNEITEAGGESMFVSGNLMKNFLNATGGSSFTSPALPLLGVAFQHVLPAELRDVTLPPPLSVDAISSLPPRPPLPPGAGFITVHAETQAEVPILLMAFHLFHPSMLLSVSSPLLAVVAVRTSTLGLQLLTTEPWQSALLALFWMQV